MSPLSNTLFFFVLFVVIVALVGAVTVFYVNRQKGLIRRFLESKNAKAIKIVWKPFDLDRSKRTYWVEYEDPKGNRTGKWCKILGGTTVVWIEYL